MISERSKKALGEVKDKKVYGFYIAVILFSFLYMLFFAASTSPLFPEWYIYDSSVFMYLARCMKHGLRIYTDLFDHKGPIIYWINECGIILAGRFGVYVIESIFLIVDVLLLKRLITTVEKNEKYMFIILCGAFVYFSYPLANGNLTEEFSLPFIIISLCFFIEDIKDDPKLLHSFAYGIGIGWCFFLRLNNAVTIFGIILCWMIILIKRKQFALLLENLIAGLIGIVAISAPILFLFRNDLYDMIYSIWFFNLKYSSGWTYLRNISDPSTIAHIIINFSPIILSMIVFGTTIKDVTLRLSLEMIVVLNMLSCLMGQGYNHYFMVCLPFVALMLACMINSFDINEGRRIIGINVALLMFCYVILMSRVVFVNIRDYYFDDSIRNEKVTVRKTLSVIPEEEREEVLGLDIPSQYYIYGDVYQVFKYGLFFSMLSGIDENIRPATISFLHSKPPRWLMVSSFFEDDEINGIIETEYMIVCENEYLRLYKLNYDSK